MNCDTKILFLDLDGTLLNDKKEITPGNMDAIHEALAAGHKIVIASGRATDSVARLAGKMGLTSDGCYAITFNGACIYDLYQREELMRRTLPIPYVRHILDAAEQFGIYAQTYASDAILSHSHTEELVYYYTTTHSNYRVVPDVCAALDREPEKVLVIDLKDHQKLCDFRDSLSGWAEGKADLFFSSTAYLEVAPCGVSKGAAIRSLCARLNIPMENTVSAGDAENDISMLQTTRISAVMKNADASMKSYGNYITEHDNNHDGIAEIIHKFIL